MANDLAHIHPIAPYQAEYIPEHDFSAMGCSLPEFVNNPVTIPPLPPVDIVCRVVYPPIVALPDIVLPPCVDGFKVIAGNFDVNLSSSGASGGSFAVTTEGCTVTIGGSLGLNIGGGGGGTGCPQTDGDLYVKDETGECKKKSGCTGPDVNYGIINVNTISLPCGEDTAVVAITATTATGSITLKNTLDTTEITISGGGFFFDAGIDLGTVAISNDSGLLTDSTRNMSIREVDCCKDGVLSKRLVLASDVYPP